VQASEAQGASKATSAPVARTHEEYQYLDLVQEILESGEHRPDR
jgi:thymidylate synthase